MLQLKKDMQTIFEMFGGDEMVKFLNKKNNLKKNIKNIQLLLFNSTFVSLTRRVSRRLLNISEIARLDPSA